MSLNAKLEQMREESWGRWPADDRAVVERANRDLAESGLFDQIVQVGEQAPDFTLHDANANDVSLSGTLRAGPVVLAFYRGHW